MLMFGYEYTDSVQCSMLQCVPTDNMLAILTMLCVCCSGQGVDQLADLIHRIRTTPEDRRLILTAWNPAALKDMALPPCHMTAQV